MSRNKHPEETVEKILNIAHELFLQKGYEQTSMQEIVEALGMSKGAIYHHFKSKEDLLMRMLERDYEVHSEQIREITENPALNGAQKIRAFLHWNLTSPALREQVRLSSPVYQNPKILVQEMYNLIEFGTPRFSRWIDEGNADGSLTVKYPYETAETLQLLFNFLFYPKIVSFSREEFLSRVRFLQELCTRMGMPVVDEELYGEFDSYYQSIFSLESV